jgi:NAD(P)H-hydrate epimerase
MIDSGRMAAVDVNAAALGVPRKQLMESGGNGVARAVRDLADPGARVAVIAGRGNNGGDGFVAARFLDDHDVSVRLLGRAETIVTDIARENWDALVAAGFDAREVADSRAFELPRTDVIVDALLGTGVSGAPREPEATAIRAINDAEATVVSVDVPSGLDGDTGEAAGVAVEADRVVTFHDTKPGLADLDAEVTVADIGIPEAAERFVGPGDLLVLRRDSASHEGDSGRVLVIGGGPYTGAPALAAQASLHAGSDLTFVAAPETVAREIQGFSPDLIVQDYAGDRLTPDRVPDLVETATSYDDTVVLGPGLGTDDQTLDAARQFLADFSGRGVVDADALAVVPDVDTDATLVLTPNRKELERLGGPARDAGDLQEVSGDIEALAADLGHVVLAKERYDLVTDGERTRLCRTGTPGMTVGGTGDTLAGSVAGLMGLLDPFQAACVGAWANGRAAELLDDERGDGLVASELMETLPAAIWGDSDE